MILRLTQPATRGSEYECDDVMFFTSDGVDGKNGGSIGIRPGHAPSLISVSDGMLEVKKDGVCLLELYLHSGIASVCNDVITIITKDVPNE